MLYTLRVEKQQQQQESSSNKQNFSFCGFFILGILFFVGSMRVKIPYKRIICDPHVRWTWFCIYMAMWLVGWFWFLSELQIHIYSTWFICFWDSEYLGCLRFFFILLFYFHSYLYSLPLSLLLLFPFIFHGFIEFFAALPGFWLEGDKN